MQRNKRKLSKWVYKRHNWILRKLRKSQKMKILNMKNFGVNLKEKLSY